MATLYISYHNTKGSSRKGTAMQTLSGVVLASEALDVPSNSADSISTAAPTEGTLGDIFALLFTTTDMFLNFGAVTPSAQTARFYLPANSQIAYQIDSGSKIAARLVV
jgi:hypothetical protein